MKEEQKMAQNVGKPVIVAGVDGSEQSKDAPRWTGRQAALTGPSTATTGIET